MNLTAEVIRRCVCQLQLSSTWISLASTLALTNPLPLPLLASHGAPPGGHAFVLHSPFLISYFPVPGFSTTRIGVSACGVTHTAGSHLLQTDRSS